MSPQRLLSSLRMGRMHRSHGQITTVVVALALSIGPLRSEQLDRPTNQRYKLTIVEGASTSKRVKKGRVSSQAVVKLTDENDVPVSGIAVAFTIPQLTGGGASFVSGGLTSIVTTNAAGIASSGTFSAASGSSFAIGAAASAPGGTVTATVPVSIATAAATGGGLSAGAIIGIIAGVGAAAGVGIAVGTKGGGSGPGQPPSPTVLRGTISGPGGPTLGAPR